MHGWVARQAHPVILYGSQFSNQSTHNYGSITITIVIIIIIIIISGRE